MRSFIFRQSRTTLYSDINTSKIVIIDNLYKALHYRKALSDHTGWSGYLKLLIRSLSKRRIFYFLQQQQHITACGTIAIGFCNHYHVSPDSAVIGSIWTDPQCRGQGLATQGLQAAINYMIGRGTSAFYIDTQENNSAMLKAIDKTGFGKPVGSFE